MATLQGREYYIYKNTEIMYSVSEIARPNDLISMKV